MKKVNKVLLSKNEKGSIQVNSIFAIFLITLLGTFVSLKVVEVADVNAKTFDNINCIEGYAYDKENNNCYKEDVVSVENLLGCKDGYNYQKDGNYKGKCVSYDKVSNKIKYTCPSGYTLNKNKCVSGNITTKAITSSSCPIGDDYYTIDGECYKIKVSELINVKKCPNGYSKKENKCIKTLIIDTIY